MKQSMFYLVIGLGVLLSGCGTEPLEEAKSNSLEQWSQKRAEMLYTMASSSYNSGKLEQAEVKAREAADLDPDNMMLRILLSRIWIDKGKYNQAETQLLTLRKKLPESTDVCYLLGITKERQGQLTEAFECYRLAGQMDEKSTAPIIAATEVQVSMGKTAAAWEYLEPRIKRGDKDPGIFELAGRLCMMLGHYDRAADFFHEARLLDIKNIAYPVMIAEAHYYAGNCIESLKWLDQVRADKEYKPSFAVETMRGDCLLILGQPPKAIRAYKAAAEIDKENVEVWNSIAKAALINADPAEAIRAANHARSLKPQDLDAALLMSTALIRQGRYPEAQKVLEEAGTMHPRRGLVHTLRGKAYEKAGDKVRARACYALANRLATDASTLSSQGSK